ncbi:MAG: DUF4143 domain-containing protein [Micrococcales bacterium]|nr:DUF4143 domain-containing protein [Micrococcales bacterium]
MLTPAGYRERLADQVVTRYLRQFGAVVIEGPKWCGKTWTGQRHAGSLVSLADPAGGFAARELALADPVAVLDPASARQGSGPPLLIDEWQEAPGLWDAVRHRVDQTGVPGQFLLTGSARPADGQVVHSGAGRIARVRMRTLSAFESGASDGRCSVAGLLDGQPPAGALPALSVTDTITMAVHGGWPAALTRREPSADLPAQYLRALAESDVPHVDGARRDPRRVTALLRSLARNNATTVTRNTLAADICADGDPTMSRLTVSRYLEALDRLFVVEQVPAWSPRLRSRTRLRTSPKLYLTDPSLTVAALRATPHTLLHDLNTFGFVFEGLCLRDLSVYCETVGAQLFHYHDDNGLEADAIIEGPDGRWGAVEIKFGSHQEDAAAANLVRLGDKMAAAGAPPTFLAVMTGTGATHTRPDGVVCAPVAAWGP